MEDLLYKRDKTADDVATLLAEHKKLIYYMLGRMGQLQNQDAESAAWEALWDAIGLFDVYSKVAFSTYACTLIRNAVNGVLRKEQAKKRSMSVATDMSAMAGLEAVDNTEDTELLDKVYAIFDEYVSCKKGVSRSVLLAWYSTSFELNPASIARACNTTASYVGRVQCAFRAYLANKLKE